MRGGIQDLKETKELAGDAVNVEKQQEQLLMSKLAANGKLPAKPQSAFLQKKLQQQRVCLLNLNCIKSVTEFQLFYVI